MTAALQDLPARLRAVVVLRDVYDLPHEADRRGARHHRGGGQGPAPPGPPQAAGAAVPDAGRGASPCSVTRSPSCCPQIVDGGERRPTARVLQPRRVVPALPGRARAVPQAAARPSHQLRTEVLEPAPGLLTGILARLEEAGERGAVRSLLTGRRAAYVGGIAAATAAAGAAGALVLAHRAATRSMPHRQLASSARAAARTVGRWQQPDARIRLSVARSSRAACDPRC